MKPKLTIWQQLATYLLGWEYVILHFHWRPASEIHRATGTSTPRVKSNGPFFYGLLPGGKVCLGSPHGECSNPYPHAVLTWEPLTLGYLVTYFNSIE